MRNFLILFLLLIVLNACEFSNYRYSMGDGFVDDPAQVIMIDTLTIKSYTIVDDSVATSYAERLLTGRLVDQMGIGTYAEGYFMIDQPESTPTTFHESAVFDSAHFVFYYDGYSIGDTTKVMKLGVYELTEDIVPDEDTDYIYGHQQFACKDQPIGTFEISELEQGDSIIMHIDNSYGQFLYNLVRDKSELISSATEDYEQFFDTIKGFVIKPVEDDPAFIFGMYCHPDSIEAPRIRIYYSDDTEKDDQSFSYPIRQFNNTTKTEETYVNKYVFNHLASSFEGTPLAELESDTFRLPSAATNEITYMQAGINMKTVFTIPYFSNLKAMGIGAVIGANLTFYPATPDNTNGFYKLPEYLEMELVDPENDVLGTLPAIDGSTSVYSTLYYSKEFPEETYYTFDISRFIKDEYNSEDERYDYGLALKLNSDDIPNSVDRLAINSQKSGMGMKLKVYLTIY